MKKILTLTLCVITLVFTGCSTYSEDTTLTESEFLVKNSEKIKNISRESLVSFPTKYHRAILSVQTPKHKKLLWGEKVDYLLSIKLSEREREFLKWLKDKHSKFDYSVANTDALDSELFDKLNKGIETFNWNRKFVYQAFFTIGNISYDSVDNEELEDGDYIGGGGGGTTCKCKYSAGCQWFVQQCRSKNCKYANYDCGILGNSECTGVCEDI